MQNTPKEKNGCSLGLAQAVERDFQSLWGKNCIQKDKLQTARIFPGRSLQDFCANAGVLELHRAGGKSSGGSLLLD